MKKHGSLKKWNDDRGFGFIESPQHEEEIFVHISAFPQDEARPKVGELISFDVQIDSKGKSRAIKVQRPTSNKSKKANHRKKSGGILSSALVIIILLVISFFGYNQFINTKEFSVSPVLVDQNKSAPVQTPTAPKFSCDGRQHCSQMTSRAEAEFFLRNCPNPKMDGDGDGIPCENDSRF
ncbi:cold shock domain-containing protein [Neptunomonas marina]|uniref:Cold-shock protein n=1 Tax=Neptunomonas marina TaxID=1815562 RepID=A0A437QED9_9GAMM|nr:cold shock domain-containing protein [Neptunomonas marina]RVU32890.1 cold-shock protein [Neptunomonas marina]